MTQDYTSKFSNRVDAFLSHPTKRVLVINGPWGVGKTYFWSKKFLPPRLTSSKLIKEKHYAYVSLFGLQSTDEVEQLICAASRLIAPGRKLRRRSDGMARSASLWAKELPFLKKYGGLVQRASRFFIKDSLICIDDIERRGKRLSMAELLGLVSVLREQSQCRLVLIMNDGELVDGEEFTKYREKIVDETVHYNPPIKDNIKLIFDAKDRPDLIDKVLSRLNVNNIRIMQQTKWVLDTFAPSLRSLSPVVCDLVWQHIVYLSCFFHIPSLGVDISQLPRDSILDYVFTEASDDDPASKEAAERLHRYGFSVEVFDGPIIDYLCTGDFDADQLHGFIAEIEDREKRNHTASEEIRVWGLYGDNFQAETSEVVEQFEAFLSKCGADLSFDKLEQTLSLVIDLGSNKRKQDYYDLWIKDRIDRAGVSELQDYKKLAGTQILRDTLDEKIMTFHNASSLGSLMSVVAIKRGWGKEDVQQLGAFSVDEIYDYLLTADDDGLLSNMRELCTFWRKRDSDSAQRHAVATVAMALRRISRRGVVDKKRVELVYPWPLKLIETVRAKRTATGGSTNAQ